MEQAQLNERRQWLFIALAGLFVTNAVTAELISNKLIQIPLKGFLFGHQFGPFTTIIAKSNLDSILFEQFIHRFVLCLVS